MADTEDQGSSAGTAVNNTTSSSGPAVRFEIKKWNAVTMWAWDICADTCAICRNSLNEPSIEYQVNQRLKYSVLTSFLIRTRIISTGKSFSKQ
jgi:hypothetical protein